MDELRDFVDERLFFRRNGFVVRVDVFSVENRFFRRFVVERGRRRRDVVKFGIFGGRRFVFPRRDAFELRVGHWNLPLR